MTTISPLAVVQTDEIGEDVQVHEFAVVRAGALLGRGVVIHPHPFVGDGVVLGDGVEVFPGAVTGKELKGAGSVVTNDVEARTHAIGAPARFVRAV